MAEPGAAAVQQERQDIPFCPRKGFELLERCAQPVWVYSYGRQQIVWANRAGLAFWDAGSRGEVRERDVSPLSVGVAQRLENLRHRLAQVEQVKELWTLYPNGVPKSAVIASSLVALEDDDLGLLCEIVPQAEGPTIADHVPQMELRAIEAVNHAPMMISLMTPTGGWLMHNPSAEALIRRLGHSNIPNIDNFASIFANPAQAVDLRDKAIQSGSARAQMRISGTLPRYHDVTLRRAVDPATGQMALILSQLDVTRSKALERRLERALHNERAMSETQRNFLSLTSHEFRTPLAIIASSVRKLRNGVHEAEAFSERLDIIGNAVARMQSAIDKTLWGGRIDAGKVPFHPVPLQLADVVSRAVAVQQELHPARMFEMRLGNLPGLEGDPGLIEQAVDNLLSNAIKFSPVEVPIAIAGSVDGDMVKLSVCDRGLGIPASDRPRLFSRFFRASNARGIKGTGIGLTAVRHFMELHGGTVELASREGRGTCVTLSFPVPRP